MWEKKKISIVFPVYNEGGNIYNAIKDFFSIGVVDEIIAVDNNSTDNSKEEILKTKAKYVRETKQGYGHALIRGIRESTGDYIITAEPDGTFVAKDILKMLPYAGEFEVVLGTRTSKALIWEGAKMNWFLRIGNAFVAKVLEYVHNGPCLTDVGCTMKLIRKESLQKIDHQFTVGGPHFSPEFMILCLRNNLETVEVPVNYLGRIGQSKITSNFWKAFKLGLVMLGLIARYKLKSKKKR